MWQAAPVEHFAVAFNCSQIQSARDLAAAPRTLHARRRGTSVTHPPRSPSATPLTAPVPRPVHVSSRPSRFRRLRRRFILLGSLALLVALVALGLQGWRVIQAIGDAQSSAVVPLPSRVPRETTTDSDAPSARAVEATRPRSEVETEPSGAAPWWARTTASGSTSNGDEGPVSGSEGASETPTPVPTSAPTVAAAQPTEAPAVQAEGDPSSLDIIREVVQAGTDRGDPGRGELWQGRESLNILVLGIDRRPDGGDQNADVVILARVDLATKRVAAVSIPRDLLVEIPGYGQDKINSAYNYGVQANPDDPAAGVALVRDTVEDAFGVPIDDYVMVDFDGFEAVVDAVGGIDITVPEAIRDANYPAADNGTKPVEFAAGPQHMNGKRALEYARIRMPDSDDQRRERQFQVLMALFEKGQGIGSIARANDIILAVGDSVQTSFPLEEQLALARVALVTNRANIQLSTIEQPMIQPGYTDAGAWVYLGDPAEVRAFVQKQLGIAPAQG